MHRPRSHTAAFTLVELLVVLGIIAMLISILMPAMNRARAQAKQIACLSNVKQISTAMQMYVNDWKKFVGYIAGPPVVDRKMMLYPYLKQGKTNSDNAVMSVWNCPANDRIDVKASYGFNTKLNFVKYTTIRRSSEKVTFCDGGLTEALGTSLSTHMWSPGTPGSTSACRPDYLRHPRQNISVGYADGHAEVQAMKPPFYPGIFPDPTGKIGNGVTLLGDPLFLDASWIANP